MSASRSQFDQRYDTIYQRGGDAAETARSVGLTAPGPAAGATPAAPVAEQSQPAFRAPAAELGGDSMAQSTGIAEVIPPDAAPQVRPEGAPAARRKINPYLVALWVLGLGLTAFGAWGSVAPYLVEMDPQGMQGFMPNGFPWFIMISTLAPNVVFAGLVIIAGALTLHAVGWIRRHG
ncbi:hypothetical protein E4J89_08165 [Arthrobacter sp. CAU 1506]|uniref:hypothetical protein n=1 Tax=Arthrobacter sp. CAU 1506 TaxID=2560052 RepID=UPI0010AD0FF6|nr:hypothetical protein [Arthrobacter sp. CAU 1506]TJY70141.1 hypothetical protein E4J89_08165 [Arthrobacter sp. CAU 1506]